MREITYTEAVLEAFREEMRRDATVFHLCGGLGALAARTSVEVTVVFDGAAVATARPPGRGIRVLFSPPGVLADHVIRDLVRAEPQGRVGLVVSSDREVVDRAMADGARTAPTAVLLAVIGG